MRPPNPATSGYVLAVREGESSEGAAFAALLRAARTTKGLTQDDVIKSTSLSRSTYLRWEGGEAPRPDLKQVREVCLFLDINPREASVALGLCTNYELGLPPPEPEFDPVTLEIGRILADPSQPAASRAALTHALESALVLWRMAVAMPQPTEPRGSDLSARRAAQR